MSYIGVIPARYGSSRFPGKVLCDLNGKPMIARTYESVMKWDKWKAVYVATEDHIVIAECEKYDIPCCMTGSHHLDCLDRASEVSERLESQNMGAEKYIIIQGDEPLFNVETLNVDMSPSIVNFYTDVEDQEEIDGEGASNAVKVVVSKNQRALYYSRHTLPYHAEKTKRNKDNPIFYKQIGVYVFTGETLKIYNQLKPSHLECMEGVGLNRLIENDIDVYMRYTPHDSLSIDTLEDRERILKLLEDE
tara:strand:- start:651 stop:1394 length:744 start_codon:yes stop_codon:yes gene_type:complete